MAERSPEQKSPEQIIDELTAQIEETLKAFHEAQLESDERKAKELEAKRMKQDRYNLMDNKQKIALLSSAMSTEREDLLEMGVPEEELDSQLDIDRIMFETHGYLLREVDEENTELIAELEALSKKYSL